MTRDEFLEACYQRGLSETITESVTKSAASFLDRFQHHEAPMPTDHRMRHVLELMGLLGGGALGARMGSKAMAPNIGQVLSRMVSNPRNMEEFASMYPEALGGGIGGIGGGIGGAGLGGLFGKAMEPPTKSSAFARLGSDIARHVSPLTRAFKQFGNVPFGQAVRGVGNATKIMGGRAALTGESMIKNNPGMAGFAGGALGGSALTQGINSYGNYRKRQEVQNMPWMNRLGLAFQLMANPQGVANRFF